MSTFRDRVSDAIAAHPDAVVLSFACVALFLVTANFLWSRRAARLEEAIEELTASRDSLTHLLQRPEQAAVEVERPEPPPPSDRYVVSDRAPQSQRETVAGAATRSKREAVEEAVEVNAEAEPAAATEAPKPAAEPEPVAAAGAPRPAAEPERVEETTEAIHGDTTVRLGTAEIPATWRAVDDDVTPAAAAWAAAPEADERTPALSPFKTMSFEPLKRAEPALPSSAGANPFEPAATVEKPAVAEDKPDAASWSRPPEPFVAPKPPAFSFTRATEPPAETPNADASKLEAPATEADAGWTRSETAAEATPTASDDKPAGDTTHERSELPRLARDPEPLPLPARTPGRPTPLEVAYDAWDSLNSAPAQAASMAADLANDPAYAAWGEVLAGNGRPSRNSEPPAFPPASPTVPAPEPVLADVSRNGHVHGNGNGHDNGANGEDVELSELTTVATPREEAPRADADAPTPALEVDAPAPAGNSGGILLVEDDDNVAKIYRIVLESKGHTVRHAGDGVAALEEVRKGRPDLVLLDVMMPRMNGILFLQSLRAQTDMRDVPVVILSNFREPRLVDRAKSLGAIEYIVKAQTRPDALLNALPRWLAGEPAFAD